MKKVILASLALATLASAPAMAASHKRVMRHDAGLAAQNIYGSADYGSASAAHDPYAAVVDGQIVGRDPDPFIRSQLIRHNTLNAD